MEKAVLGIDERPKIGQWILFSLQHLFAMFGATILVPMLTGLDPAVALVTSGLGTLVYIAVTRGQAPAYLGSSFAFIAPIIAGTELFGGPEGAMVGIFFVGVLYVVVALIISKTGVNWLTRLLPPVVIGPVIMVIGLRLASVAVTWSTEDVLGERNMQYFAVAMVTLGITVLVSMYGKGFFNVVPILFGVIGGYLFALILGMIDLAPVAEASWFAVPNFRIPFVTHTPEISLRTVMFMIPVTIVPLAEHLGDQMVISKIVGRDILKTPGLQRTILGDGLATMLAGLLGGPANTTYGENIGVMAITKVHSVYVFAGAAVFAVTFGFIGKVSALIGTIPRPVMGGICILLFGIIATSGLRMMIEAKIDFAEKRNLIIPSVSLIVGVGGATLNIGDVVVSGMALTAVVGIILNLILPRTKKASTLL